jgi:hypothetical protein
LADEGFLTLKSKEIRDSESPTREFHQHQERNAKNESSSSTAGGEGGYWRIVQESSSGAYESTSTTGERGDTVVCTTSKNEHRSLVGDSGQEGFTTATQVSSSEQTSCIPQSGGSNELDTTDHKSVIATSNIEGATHHEMASSASRSYSGKWSSSLSTSHSANSSQKYQQNEKTSTVTSSIISDNQDSKICSGLEDSGVAVSDSARLSSPTGGSHNIISSTTTAANQISSSQGSKHRVTQRSQTEELVGRTAQSTSEKSDVTTTALDKTSGTASNIVTKDGSSCSNKTVEQRIMSELNKLDSFLSTENTAADVTHVSQGGTHDSKSWTVVSSDKSHINNKATDEFVFHSGHITQDEKDSTTQQNTNFIEQERTSSIVNHSCEVKESASTAPNGTDEKTVIAIKENKPDLKKPTSETTEEPKRGVTDQDTTARKDSADTTGQYVTTYQQAYTNKRISVDLSPTHEAFARSLRASPERATPPSSTRSSSKASLDRSSPDRFNKSPTRTYRNRTSLDNPLAAGRTSPDKTTKSRSSPTRASPEKSTDKSSSSYSGPEKSPARRSPSRVSPEKTTKYPDGTAPSRESPEKTAKSLYSPKRESADKTRSPVMDGRSSPEKAIKTPQNDRFSPRASPEKSTRPLHVLETAATVTSCDNTQEGKTSHLPERPERRISSGDKPRDTVPASSQTRKTSDSMKTYSSTSVTSNRDSAVKVTTKEKRKLSSGLSRATTKKRSSTPGVSPHTSPTRSDETTPRTERQSRPRSRGSSSHSSSDTEDSETDMKPLKPGNVIDIEDKTDRSILKTIIQTATDKAETVIKGTEYNKTNTEYYITDEKDGTVVSDKIKRKPDEQILEGRKSCANSDFHKGDDLSENVSEDDVPQRIKVNSPLSSSPERAQEVSSSTTTVSRKVSSKDVVGAKAVKHKDSTPATSKVPVKKSSKEEPFHPTKRSPSPQKIKPGDAGTKITLSGKESTCNLPTNIPKTNTESPKSVLDKLPRDKSPEYSSEGSLVHELNPRHSTSDARRNVSSPVKHPKEVTKKSPDSSPERGNFKPIKCFRTSPEIRPSTLEFAHPQKQTPFVASPEKPESPTKPLQEKSGDDDATKEESESEEFTELLTEPYIIREPIRPSEPIFTRGTDFKKSPERPNTSPAFENDYISPASSRKLPSTAKGESDIFSTEPSTAMDTTSPQLTKQKILETKEKPDQNSQYPTRKKTPDNQTRKFPQGLDSISVNSAPEQKEPGHMIGQPPEKLGEENPENGYDEIKHLPECAKTPKTEDQDIDKSDVQASEKPKFSCSLPSSSGMETPLATTTAEITLKFTTPDKHSPQDKKPRPAKDYPSPSAVLQKPDKQCPSDTSPERESLKRLETPTRRHPQKLDDTSSSKQTLISTKISDAHAKPIIKKSGHSLPSPSQSPEKLKNVPVPSGTHSASKVTRLTYSKQTPSKSPSSVQTPRRQSEESSPSPHSSPDRTSENRAVTCKNYDTSPDSRRSTSLSPKRGYDEFVHPNKVSVSPEKTPSSSPERHRSPVKIRPSAVKTSIKHSSRIPQSLSPSSSPEKHSRIPSSCTRDHPGQSPIRTSQPLTKPNENISRPSHSPGYPSKQSLKPDHSPATTSQSPARPSQPLSRTNQPPARFNQSPARPSSSPSGPRYQTEKLKKPGSDTVPIKSAFVKTPKTTKDSTNFSKSPREPGCTSDQFPGRRSPVKQTTRPSPSSKCYPTTREPKQQKPVEIDDERSTDRSSTVSSPETVKTAEDSTAVDTTYVASNQVVGMHITPTSHKHTEMFVPQLSNDRVSTPSDNNQDDTPVSLSALTDTTAIKTGEIAPTYVTISVTSNRKRTTKDTFENKPHRKYYSDECDVVDLQDETPPEEFLVEDDSPVGFPLQSYSAPGKPQNFPEDVRDAPQTRAPRDESPKSKLMKSIPTSRSGRTITVAAKISEKNTTTNETQKLKQERFSIAEKKVIPTSHTKSRPKDVTTVDIRITQSSSDKNVIEKHPSSPKRVQPRHVTSKPVVAIARTTITRNKPSSRQGQATTVVTETARVLTTRTKKVPTTPVKPAQKSVTRTEEQNRINNRTKSTVTADTRSKVVTKNQAIEKSSKHTKKKLVNGVSGKPHTSSSEDEQDVPEAVTDDEKEPAFLYVDDEHSETYIRELEELRRTDEQQYASKLTAVRTQEHKLLSPSHEVPGIIIQPLRSSRESSPECPRQQMEERTKPRYADRISEPEDDDDISKQYKSKPTAFQKPIIHAEDFDEEYTDDDSKPKTRKPVGNSEPNKCPSFVSSCSEQVTDLDEESETEDIHKSVSVADRVSHFLETTRNAACSAVLSSEPAQPIDSSPKSLDSPSTVRRARAMFETIASSQTSTHKDTTKQNEILNIFDRRSRESPLLESKKTDIYHSSDQENLREPGNVTPFSEEQFPEKDIILHGTPGTKYPASKLPFNEYSVVTEKDSPYYRDSYPVSSKGDVETPRTLLTDNNFHQKSPSPEFPGCEEPAHSLPRGKSPTSKMPSNAYLHHKPSTTPDRSGGRNYDTYTKVKSSKENTSISKPTVAKSYSPSDLQLRDTSPVKDDQPIKKVSQWEPSFNSYSKQRPSHNDSPELKDTLTTREDTVPKKGQLHEYPKGEPSVDTYTEEEGLPSSRNESKLEKDKPQGTHPRRQSVREDVTLIETFTKDTTTQREILRQKDILNRPSVFEARCLASSVKPEQFNQPYEFKTSGYPSDDDLLVRSDIKYSTDTFTKKKPLPNNTTPSKAETYPNQEYPQDLYIHGTISSTKKDSQPKKHFSTDTYPKRKPSKDDTSPTRKDAAPRKDSPVRQDTGPGTVKGLPARYDSYPTRERSPSRNSTALRKVQPEDVGASRKGTIPKDGIAPQESSSTRRISSPKDKTAAVSCGHPAITSSRESSPIRKFSKDTSPARKEPYHKRESLADSSPSRKYSPSKDTSPARKESSPKRESPADSSPTRKYSSPKDTSPSRRESSPKGKSPADSFPTRKYSSPKDTSPERKESSPKRESPADSSPTTKYSSPKHTSPTRNESSSELGSPRDISPTRKFSSPRYVSPTRKDSYPRGDSYNISPATKQISSPYDSSPTRKDSHPVTETPRDASPTRKYSAPIETSPTRKESHPTRKQPEADDRYPCGGSLTSRETSPKRTSPTRPETKSATLRKDSLQNRYHNKEDAEMSTVRGSGRFGVNLRRTGSAVSSTIQRHLSGETPKYATGPNKKGDEPDIEEIFDLELLERLVSYFFITCLYLYENMV